MLKEEIVQILSQSVEKLRELIVKVPLKLIEKYNQFFYL